MKVVAEQLVSLAKTRTLDEEVDLFARSSFNRYYYASYLLVRDAIGNMDEKWRATGHGSIPELLKGRITKVVRAELNSQKKAGLLSPSEYSKKRTSFDKAIEELSRLMEEGYQTRVTADYCPEDKVEAFRGDYKLFSKTTSEARGWVVRAERYSGTLLKVWKDLSL